MVTEPTAATEETIAPGVDSTLGTAGSDPPNALVADGTAPPETEDEAAEQEDAAEMAETAAPALRTPDSFGKPELDQLYREGGLTDPALVERRERLTQSENDRAANERRVLDQIRQRGEIEDFSRWR